MKLFQSVCHRGADVYECGEWVITHMTCPYHTYVFGRYRPKVDDAGNIIPECNLDDWETLNGEKITAENKAKRDNPELPFVADGLYGGSWETIWCTSGWGYPESRQWGRREGRGNRYDGYCGETGYIAFMDCSTGYLYQYGGCGSILDETDSATNLLSRGGGMKQLLIRQPTLYKALIDSGFLQFIRPQDQPDTAGKQLSYLTQAGLMTKSGSVKIRNARDFKLAAPLLDYIDEIKIMPSAQSQMQEIFQPARTEAGMVFPTIDLNGIRDANRLFYRVKFKNETLRLKNTE